MIPVSLMMTFRIDLWFLSWWQQRMDQLPVWCFSLVLDSVQYPSYLMASSNNCGIIQRCLSWNCLKSLCSNMKHSMNWLAKSVILHDISMSSGRTYPGIDDARGVVSCLEKQPSFGSRCMKEELRKEKRFPSYAAGWKDTPGVWKSQCQGLNVMA